MDVAVSQIVLLGVLMAGGFVVGLAGERLGIPRAASYVFFGMLFSDDLLARFIPFSTASDWAGGLTDVALGAIAFLIGTELPLQSLKAKGRMIGAIVGAQSLGAFLLVSLGLWLYGVLWDGGLDPAVTLVLGAIAAATAPAATIAVIDEYRARGPLSETLLGLVAIDDALAVILFSLVLGFTGGEGLQASLLEGGREIAGSVLLGLILGASLGGLGIRIAEDDLRLPLIVGFVLLTVGLALVLDLSSLLSCMVLGIMVRLLEGKAEIWLSPMNHIKEAIFLIFFTVAGSHFLFDVFFAAMGLILAYSMARAIGKYWGAWLGAYLSNAPEVIRRNTGIALLPQAGVSIGLALVAQSQPGLQAVGSIVLNTVLGSTLLFELAGPIATRFALHRAGEIKD